MKKIMVRLMLVILIITMCTSQVALAASNHTNDFIQVSPSPDDYYLSYTQGDYMTFKGTIDDDIETMICGLVPDGTDINDLYKVGFSHYVIQKDKFIYLGEVTETVKDISQDTVSLFPGQNKYVETTVVSTVNTSNVLPGAYRFVVLMVYGDSMRLAYFYQDVGVEKKLIATPTNSIVYVDGVQKNFQAYCIDGNNYFKLRDLAYTLSDSRKQFNVVWDSQKGMINLLRNQPYTVVGGEMTGKGNSIVTPVETGAKIILDSREVSLFAYTIEGNNYFKLRDIAGIFDFNVTWDGTNNAIIINTSESYSAD